jgi:hypothetical protein
MWRLLFLSTTSLALAVAACSDDGGSCGPKSAPEFGLVATNGSDVALTYGGLSSSPNHDCPDPNAPMGVEALTVTGPLSGGTGFINFCIPRPDLLATTPGRLGFEVKLVDLSSTLNSCQLTLNSAAVPSGTVTADGMCDNGQNKAGYALTVTGNAVLSRDCGGTIDMVPVALSGTVAVSSP